jgi:hypothetical protein
MFTAPENARFELVSGARGGRVKTRWRVFPQSSNFK